MKLQNDYEIFSLIRLMGKLECDSYLEIGSETGETFVAIGAGLKKAVSIDLPRKKRSVHKILLSRRDYLRKCGVDAHVILGNSHDRKLMEWALLRGPYDAVFIDGDHSYSGVKSDWENYRGLAKKVVVFHDIIATSPKNPERLAVHKLWREIKDEFRTLEIIEPDSSRKMGIGVVFVND